MQKSELADAYQYYSSKSFKALQAFDNEIDTAYLALEISPFYKVRYRNLRSLPLNRFPYILLFTVDEINARVEIRSVFNTSRDPKNYE